MDVLTVVADGVWFAFVAPLAAGYWIAAISYIVADVVVVRFAVALLILLRPMVLQRAGLFAHPMKHII